MTVREHLLQKFACNISRISRNISTRTYVNDRAGVFVKRSRTIVWSSTLKSPSKAAVRLPSMVCIHTDCASTNTTSPCSSLHPRKCASSTLSPNNATWSEDDRSTEGRIIYGPSLTFEKGKIAYLADSSIMGSSGDTVALAIVTVSPLDNDNDGVGGGGGGGGGGEMTNNINNNSFSVDGDSSSSSSSKKIKDEQKRIKMVRRFLEKKCRQESSSHIVPLTVDYRQRHHAVGKIPSTASRTDNRRPTVGETLASRAIDRALRPLLEKEESGNEQIHLTCSLQACPLNDDVTNSDDDGEIAGRGGHPVALALNSASFALRDRLKEPVAAVYLRFLEDGTIVTNTSTTALDPTMSSPGDSYGELLYAGTRDAVVMMEFSGHMGDNELTTLLEVAHSTIQPILDILEGHRDGFDDTKAKIDDDALRAELGLEALNDSSSVNVTSDNSLLEEEAHSASLLIYNQALVFCRHKLGEAGRRVFGCTAEDSNADHVSTENPVDDDVSIHNEAVYGPLLSKALRGRREHLFREEIRRLLLESFMPSNLSVAQDYDLMKKEGENSTTIGILTDSIHTQILREAMQQAVIAHTRRADGRGGLVKNGCKVIRPLSIEVPALPSIVHGSALFGRGETQVLVTTTLGSPRDTMPVMEPFQVSSNRESLNSTLVEPSHDLPVGSLRYLKSSGSEYIEADLNTRRIMADREQTGDSGTLKERRRAYLQYDFPAYSKGEVQSGPSNASRREIGHGALAEKSILPILPPARTFPYAVRLTSEVTSSNGSSSMASVCGATLSLVDAGVPILAPAAGVSIGAVVDKEDGSYGLMVDLTGTEDHYGVMDFKIAGTSNSVTGFQLDVKNPLPMSLILEALDLSKECRNVILEEMEDQYTKSSDGALVGLRPRSELKSSAPRVEVVRFSPERKKDLLGPGGVVARQMEDRFDVSMDLTQEGQCLLFGDDKEMVKKAKNAVMDLVSDVEVGLTYEGTVIEIKDFGIIVELLRNKEGLCHVSELADRDTIRTHPNGPFGLIKDLVMIGQKLEVVVKAVDPVQGSVKLGLASKL